MNTKEQLNELGYIKKRDLTREEIKQMKIANYYFNRAQEMRVMGAAHIQKQIATMTIELGTIDFQLLDDKELFVKGQYDE